LTSRRSVRAPVLRFDEGEHAERKGADGDDPQCHLSPRISCEVAEQTRGPLTSSESCCTPATKKKIPMPIMSADRPAYPIRPIVSIVFVVFSSADSILSMNSVATTYL
jgi:hypothetical protein